MATQIIGDVAVNNIVLIGPHAAGTLPFGPVAIPAGLSVLLVVFDLQQVTSLTAVFTAAVQLSLDNGATFQDVIGAGLDLSRSGFTLQGNVLTRSVSDPLGAGPVRDFAVQVILPHTELATRQVQGTVACSEAATSGATVVAF